MTSAIFNAASYDSLGGSSLTAVANGISWLRAETQSYSYVRDYPTDLLMYLSQKGIEIENRGKSIEFLAQHPGMIPHLYDLPEALEAFSNNSYISLQQIGNEEDSITEGENLVSVIRTRLPIKDAREVLRSVQRSWLFKIPEKDMALFSPVLELKSDV